jgi:hypothetical protein
MREIRAYGSVGAPEGNLRRYPAGGYGVQAYKGLFHEFGTAAEALVFQ